MSTPEEQPNPEEALARAHAALRDTGRPRHSGDPSMAELPRFSRVQQPALPLVQMRRHRLQLRPQRTDQLVKTSHTTSTNQIPGSNQLISDGPWPDWS